MKALGGEEIQLLLVFLPRHKVDVSGQSHAAAAL
jgi:hypothetical protein